LKPAILKGYDYFLNRFFTTNASVKYYHDRDLPVDMHAVATAIITLVELSHYHDGSLPLAARVLSRANATMRSNEGWYYYQQKKLWTVRIPYMRWTQSWMLSALTSLALSAAEGESLEVSGS
jgi:hypothetical protein